MKKKLLSLALALALCLSLTVPALAAQKTLYLKGDTIADTSASDATFILTGDVSRTKDGIDLNIDTGRGGWSNEGALFTSNGPVKVETNYSEKAIGDYILVNEFCIYGMKYNTATKSYEI